MQGENDLILKGFKDIVIYETNNDSQEIFGSVENPFRAKKLIVTSYLIFIFYVLIVSNCFYILLYIIPHCITVINMVKNTNEKKGYEFCFYWLSYSRFLSENIWQKCVKAT